MGPLVPAVDVGEHLLIAAVVRERMVRTHDRMLTLVKGAGPVKEQMSVYFTAMRGKEGERPMQALGALVVPL